MSQSPQAFTRRQTDAFGTLDARQDAHRRRRRRTQTRDKTHADRRETHADRRRRTQTQTDADAQTEPDAAYLHYCRMAFDYWGFINENQKALGV